MRKAIIMSGISGSGKSTYAKKNFPQLLEWPTTISADDYFMKDGRFLFDPAKIGDAHNSCFRQFMDHINNNDEDIVVDNTNCEVWEIAPYVLATSAYGFDHEIITLYVSRGKLEECAARNIHGVPPNVLDRMFAKLNELVLPAHWNHTIFMNGERVR